MGRQVNSSFHFTHCLALLLEVGFVLCVLTEATQAGPSVSQFLESPAFCQTKRKHYTRLQFILTALQSKINKNRTIFPRFKLTRFWYRAAIDEVQPSFRWALNCFLTTKEVNLNSKLGAWMTWVFYIMFQKYFEKKKK